MSGGSTGERSVVRAVQRRFGPPEVLSLERAPRPTLEPHDVLVRVLAASLNPIDAKSRSGEGVVPASAPFPITLGWDVAGIVDEVGPRVTRWQVGERVFGMPTFPGLLGGHGTHVTAREELWVGTPPELDDVTAAALPLAGLTAWQAWRTLTSPTALDRILVHGATGGVGHLAVQTARRLGAHVTATCSAHHGGRVQDFGAHEVVDYRDTAAVAALSDHPVDTVLDLIGGDHVTSSIEATKPGGTVIVVTGPVTQPMREQAERRGVTVLKHLVTPDPDGLQDLARLAADGALAVAIDRTYDLAEIVQAHRHIERGGVVGKLVLRTPHA